MSINLKVRAKAYCLDATINYIIFTPTVLVINTLLFHWNIEQQIGFIMLSIPISFGLGGIFGRILNLWREFFGYA